jgi:hypothetical protein
MSVSDESSSVSDESGRLPAAMLREDPQARAVRLRAEQPAGAVFALGWVMAELFDPRRRVSVTENRPPFDPDTQLPQVADLAADPKLVFLAGELAEYLHWFPHLERPLRPVTAQVNKKRPAVAAENLATARAAEEADGVRLADDAAAAVTEEPFSGTGRERFSETGRERYSETRRERFSETGRDRYWEADQTPFSETELLAAVTSLHQAILDAFADDPERLSAYQLGLALSDLVWIPSPAVPGRPTLASRPSALLGLFARAHLATVQTLLSGAGTQLPAGAATIVSRSLDNWASWIDVNSARIRAAGPDPKSPGLDEWSPEGDVVLRALRVQGWVWHSVLIADPEVSVQPGTGAWVEAASSIARTARMTAEVFVRRFWPVLVLGLVTLAGLLYLVISNLSGVAQVWASLVTVAAVLGSGTWGLGSGVSSAFSGVGYEIWSSAKVDAAAWNVTWLPALTTTTLERLKMEQRGVAMPQIRKSLDG